MTAMRLAEIWRYPVKSMAGEQLTEATLDTLGVPGDRALYVVDRGGRVVTARRRPRLLGLRATTSPAGDILVDGLPWRDEEVGRLGCTRRRARVLDWWSHWVMSGSTFCRCSLPPMVPSHSSDRSTPAAAEPAAVGLADLRQRCIMTTWDPDTGAQDVGVLRAIQRQFGGSLALNAWTAESGRVGVGDVVELVASRPRPALT